MGELKSLTYKTPSKASPFEQTERLQFLAGQLRSISEDLRDDVAAAYRGNRDGALKHSIDSAFTALGSRTNTYLHDLNAGDVASTGVLAANGSYNRAVESAVGAFATAQLALVRLLEKRIGELLEKMRWSMFLTGALAALSIFMAAMTHWHVVRPLRRFENVASAVRDLKDYGLRVDYSGRDEIGRLVSAFNDMLAELASAHERERSKQHELARNTRLTTMGAMTASIAHEINQPLAAIVNNSNAAHRWLSNTPPNLDEARAALKSIVREGHRASDVIGSVRAIFKRDSRGKDRLTINDVIEEILTLVQGDIRRYKILLGKELSPGLPQVVADRTQLQQVIMNLTMNAIETMAMVTDRERRLVIQSHVLDAGNLEITIKDFGFGINPSEKDRIFDAFYTTKSEGMGMGLFICRSIIEAHGGRLSASPGIDHGSVFHVVIPSVQ